MNITVTQKSKHISLVDIIEDAPNLKTIAIVPTRLPKQDVVYSKSKTGHGSTAHVLALVDDKRSPSKVLARVEVEIEDGDNMIPSDTWDVAVKIDAHALLAVFYRSMGDTGSPRIAWRA